MSGPGAIDPVSELATRKSVELEVKLSGLEREFQGWLDETGTGKPLRKHATQVRRLTEQLTGMTGGVREKLGPATASSERTVAQARVMQLRILEVHRLWDFFRAKLALRYIPAFVDYLAAADDLAWECYAPVRAQPAESVESLPKAAPLVFFSDDFSPYTHARTDAYDIDGSGEIGEIDLPILTGSQFRELAAALPIPVIGVPWYQAAHLPDLPLLAHEVGHDADVDLDLVTVRRQALDPVLDGLGDRRGPWLIWQDELFADVYGTLALGSAFVAALMDLLATDRQTVAREAAIANPVAHPPAGVRMRAATEVLRLLGGVEAADRYWAGWTAMYPPAPTDRYLDDVPSIVAALDKVSFPNLGGTLRSQLSFTPDQDITARAEAGDLRKGIAPTQRSIRVLVAAARHAYDADPAGFTKPPRADRPSPSAAILSRITALRSDAPRGNLGPRPSVAPATDRAAGRALLDRLTALTSEPRDAQPEGPT